MATSSREPPWQASRHSANGLGLSLLVLLLKAWIVTDRNVACLCRLNQQVFPSIFRSRVTIDRERLIVRTIAMRPQLE